MDTSYEITDDLKHDVLAGTDLVALVGAVTGLKKAGNSWKGLCPFHGEKTPSFHVHPEKGFYYCFGCGAKGDAITFVRETERLEFAEAVAYLARRAGVTLPVRRSGTRVDRAKETRVAEALSAAAAFFREALPRHAAAVAPLASAFAAGPAFIILTLQIVRRYMHYHVPDDGLYTLRWSIDSYVDAGVPREGEEALDDQAIRNIHGPGVVRQESPRISRRSDHGDDSSRLDRRTLSDEDL